MDVTSDYGSKDNSAEGKVGLKEQEGVQLVKACGWQVHHHEWPQRADVEIMVYLGILDTRKYFGSQKISTNITAILS